MTYEGLRLNILKIQRKGMSKWRRKKLQICDFTIISNNCYGGMIYESYNLPKQSPTIGMFFMPADYIKFVSNLKGYLFADLKFIKPNESVWRKEVCIDRRFGSYPIGVLNDIEIFFLHYHSEEEARDKWNRRCQRINWDRLIVKFNDQNGCTEKHIKAFDSLPYKNKLCFTVAKYPQYQSVISIKAPKSHTFIRASYEPFGNNKNFNITDFINKML